MSFPEQFSLKDKRIVITGASSGIGRACAISCAEAGAKVLLMGRNEERLQETMESMEGSGHWSISLDLTKYKTVEERIKKWTYENGSPNGLINAAGISTTYPFKYSKPEQLHPFFEVNVYAGFNFTRLFTQKPPKEGMSVIFITSIMASVGEKAKSTYSMTKGALLSGSRSLALELASKNIRVNCVSPGVVETPMTKDAVYNQTEEASKRILMKHPLGIGKPEDVANACVFLLSEASRWITGTDIRIDGGYTAR